MLLDRAFRRALSDYSTLFLMVAVVTVTLHLAYSVIFRDVISMSDLHPELSLLRPNAAVRGVGPNDLSTSETFYWILTALEIAAIPFLVAGAGRILQVEAAGGVPTVSDAYRHMREVRTRFTLRFDRSGWATVALGAVSALAIGYMFERSGLLLTEVLPDDWLFLGAGLVRGLSRAVPAPFFLAALVTASEEATPGAPAV